MKTAKEIMTQNVISVNPETSVVEAVNIFLKHNFNGLPVTTQGGYLVGILTEQDLIIRGTSIHLPTFIKLFQQIDLYKKDSALIKEDLKKILELKVEDIMNKEPFCLEEGASIFQVVDAFENKLVNPVPVVNKDKILIGIISRYDLLKFMGDAEVNMNNIADQENMDKNINTFIDNFDKKFILVSKARTKWWLVASILFAILGFAIAYALILRLNF